MIEPVASPLQVKTEPPASPLRAREEEHQAGQLDPNGAEREQSCLLFNRFCLKFCSQMAVLTMCVVYSLVELSNKDNSNKEFWASLLSFSIGVIVPSPENKIHLG
jgi:hypothetical protein